MPQSQQLILGIDGGGSKTACWLAAVSADDLPRILGCGTSGPGNPRSVGFATAFENVLEATEAAFHEAAVLTQPVSAGVICMAGAGRQEEQEKIRAWAVEQQLAIQLAIENDARALLAAGHAVQEHHRRRIRVAGSQCLTEQDSSNDPWDSAGYLLRQDDAREHAVDPQRAAALRSAPTGVALIAGTGSMAFAQDASGNQTRCGGWGYLLGDEGSGFAIAAAALRQICQSADGRDQPTKLTWPILEQLDLTDVSQLVGWVYRAETLPRHIARLAPHVFQQQHHDPLAKQIVDQALDSLARHVQTVVRRSGFAQHDYLLALGGGLLTHQPEFTQRLLEQLNKLQTSPSTVAVIDSPVLGALWLASGMLAKPTPDTDYGG